MIDSKTDWLQLILMFAGFGALEIILFVCFVWDTERKNDYVVNIHANPRDFC